MRVKRLKNESHVIIKLRKQKQSFDEIAGFLGRSKSFIAKTLKFNHELGTLTFFDLRTLPTRIKKLSKIRQHFTMLKLWKGWEAYLLGEVDKPP